MANINYTKPNKLEDFSVWCSKKYPLWCKSNFPFIEDTFEALDTYGLICKIVQYLNETKQNLNTTEDNVQNIYDFVSNYFDNLDVQKEINNKLDDMKKTGELQTILNELFNNLKNETDEKISLQNNKINNIQNEVSAIASGSPSGVYDTLEDLIQDNPSHDKIYIVLEDGEWYYWDSDISQWNNGGVYQSTGIQNKSIDVGKCSFINHGIQLFNREDLIEDIEISYVTGVENSNENFVSTKFIDVLPNQNLYPESVYRGDLIYYNSNKEFISGVNLLNENVQTVPSNCYYIRLSINKEQVERFSIGLERKVGNSPFYNLVNDLKTIIKEGEIKENKISFITTGRNKYNKATITKKAFKLYQNGFATTANENFSYSDFIPTKENQLYYISQGNQNQICYYDEFYNYISGDLLTSDYLTTPINSKYTVISCPISQTESKMFCEALNEATIYPYEPYKIIIDNLMIKKEIYVGNNREIKTLKEGIEEATKYNNSILYVDSGEYNIIEEYGNEYFENFTASQSDVGLVLKNDIHVVFSPNSKVICHYRGNNENVQKRFSPFNAGHFEGSKGFIIENLNLECSNVRYGIHDEHGNDSSYYKNHYINCNIDFDNSLNTVWGATQCIGGGLGRNGEIIIENSIFYSHRNTFDVSIAISYHNSGVAEAKSKVIIKDNYFKENNTMRISYHGESTEITDVIICNNSLGNIIDTRAETEESLINNMNIIQFNNEIRQ